MSKSTVIRIYDESTGELLQKQCSKCGKVKDISEFSKHPRNSDGLRSNCKGCMKERREANKEYYKKYKKEYMKTPEGKAAQARAYHKRRALKKDNGGSYTSEQWNQCLEYFNNCDAYTGESLESTEIEHVIPISKGGTSDIYNIVPANKSTNCSKHNSDVFEWYSKQEYFSWDRYLKICMWIIKNM